MKLYYPEATEDALRIIRNGAPFEWTIIPLLALVIYVYLNEIQKGNWRGIAAGLGLYMLHWTYEIGNGLIQHATGHALWTVPTGTAFLLLIGVGVELSLTFSVAGLVLTKVLPDDPRRLILGMNNRLVFIVGNAAFFSVFEIFLAKTPAFVWVYPWWGALPVFLTVYVPFFAMAVYCYDWRPVRQIRVVGGLFGLNLVSLGIFGGLLHWI